MSETILVALITGGLALLGTFLSNRKSAALIAYRLEQLENKVNKHNNVIERTYRLEEKAKALGDRVEDLEKRWEG
ncbi:MAG: hypothetical protein IJQ98_13360 [Oscillospiraceae bacterium]|nr:hypothetical protein [Oscillospiraceae bacterium]